MSNSTTSTRLSGSRHWRTWAVVVFDLCCVVTAWIGAYGLRFNLSIPGDFASVMLSALVLLVPVEAVIFNTMGLYRGIWVFASLPDLQRILKSVGLSALITTTLVVILYPGPPVPRSVLILYPLLLLIAMAGGRAAYRMWKEHRLYGALMAKGKPVVVLGAGRAGANLVRELGRSGEWYVVGLLDDNPSKHGREILGHKVLGPIDALPRWAEELHARHAIIAMSSVSEDVRRRAASLCVRAGIAAYTIPSIDQLLVGHETLSHVRRLDLDDLLGRTPVRIDAPQVSELLRNHVVMVTGAGGSIGSELCRQIARFGPAQLVFYENNEFALYRLCEEFAEHFPEIAVVPLAGDVRDSARIEDVLTRYVPSVLFHAAAYKHVPLMEEHNAWQAIRNNVFGTWTVANGARRAGVGKFVFISTDKAVNPTNIMGASKRLAEMICQSLQQIGGSHTQFEMVRFGNVLGSAGSVIPKFQSQIDQGGPVTVTHPEIARFFMSIPEAAQLVLQAAAMGEGGEIFVLDMGDPVRIVDLAHDMIRLSGRSEDEVRIVFSGLRPGEKLYEELLADDEPTRPTHHPKVRVAKGREVQSSFLDELLFWLKVSEERSDAEVRRDLRRWVPEYRPAVGPELRPVQTTKAIQAVR